jgi:toxin ParE1/3/4
MNRAIKYTQRSLQDLLAGVAWYEEKRRGLGFEFLNSIEQALSRIRDCPDLYRIIQSPIRRCLIRRFPFSIYFSDESNEIVIHAVFDNRMNPSKITSLMGE